MYWLMDESSNLNQVLCTALAEVHLTFSCSVFRRMCWKVKVQKVKIVKIQVTGALLCLPVLAVLCWGANIYCLLPLWGWVCISGLLWWGDSPWFVDRNLRVILDTWFEGVKKNFFKGVAGKSPSVSLSEEWLCRKGIKFSLTLKMRLLGQMER